MQTAVSAALTLDAYKSGFIIRSAGWYKLHSYPHVHIYPHLHSYFTLTFGKWGCTGRQ